MKTLFRSFTLVLLVLLLCIPISAEANLDAKALSEKLQEAVPAKFGYVDNSEYYMSSYFSGLEDVDDFYIVTCADSTNFNEIGVFHLKSNEHLAANHKLLKKYLLKIKQNFESGVVYNIEEYPKFENAKVFSVGNYLVYTVLDRAASQKAEQAARSALKKA